MAKSLYLVDVSSMFFRAFYAIRPLTSPSGVPVNAVYGYLSMVTKLLREIRPDTIAFCFDRPEPSFRKAIDERYKANRTEMPEDLVPQIPIIRKLSEALGVQCIDRLGFEADDIIGTLAQRGAAQGYDVVIVSGDKDFGQLVNDRISLYDTMKDQRFRAADVLEKWGVDPRKMIDYLALVGDTSDNVKGVQGIGPKGAQKLLATYDSLEDIYANIDSVEPEGIRKKLIAGRDEAFLAKKLVTIVLDVPLDVSIDDLKLKSVSRENVQPMLDELGFKTLSRQLFGASPEAPTAGAVTTPAQGAVADPSANTRTLSPELQKFVKPAKKSESSGLPQNGESAQSDFIDPKALLDPPAAAVNPQQMISHLQPGPYWAEAEISISELGGKLESRDPSKEIWVVHSERGLYIGFDGVCYQMRGDPKDLAAVLEGRALSGFHIKEFAHRYELNSFTVNWDAQLAAYVEHAGSIETAHEMFKKYLGLSLPDLASGSQWLAMHFALRRELEAKLEKQNGLKIYFDFEIPLVPILYRMERRGILIDRPFLAEMSKELAGELKSTESEIHSLCGEVFNIGSPKQMSQVLFVKMGLPSGKLTKTGFSTDNEVLEGLDHPVAKLILNWRELSKLKSTYVDALPSLADSAGRVHTTFNQALTMTGRLSSQNPNLQNIPIRTERGARIRKAFLASQGCDLISADYSQIELRVLAHITEDPGLIKAFAAGHDIHAATAAEVFEVPLADVNSDMRRKAKAVNFGLAYGQGAFGLAETLGIKQSEAKAIIERYFTRFARVKDFMFTTVEDAKKRGYVETVFGRRRYLPELSAKNGAVRKFGERAAINAPIQGTASDLVKKAMIDVDRAIGSRDDVTMLLQVHDELIFDVKAQSDSGSSRELESKIQNAMEKVADFKVPLVANLGRGKNWGEAH